MPLIKIIRGGQVTFPKVFRDKFGLKEGDLMEYEIREDGIFFKPKEVIDRGGALQAFSEAIAKMQAKAGNKFKSLSEEELYDLIEKAVQSIEKPKTKKR
ncbi:AbrB/MazE/SpoVT family DNA-binding domain-containing protein [Desulfobacca acetoxidans]|uniref:Transcriptional regulator, AbrB family n=1 Tax=Desulfobacca acetoxidans (strain ATCC 700848 / DSM 11109 / ASRB2) TaxID=880072 RepID=F2NGP7_DESAR|nr:AbrB/MazE/SpoVT family DNA-binding domain-containing protein [Desulfobacca acetoxidans]AEB07954.1 transcriptional regulator, AbrB family [Desulfobacca acetoxidans DSM 11109]